MTQLPEPSAKRLQRPSWRDARLLVGVVLVLLGAAVGARIIASADDTVPMYAASTVIRPGDRLRATTCGGSTSSWATRRPATSRRARLSPTTATHCATSPTASWSRPPVGARSTVTVQPSRSRSTPARRAGCRRRPRRRLGQSRDTQSTQERYLDATLALERVVSPRSPRTPAGSARRRRRWPFSCRSRATRSPRSSPPSTSSRGSPWCRSRARAPRDACPHGARNRWTAGSRPSSRPRASEHRPPLRGSARPRRDGGGASAPSHSSPATCAVST